MVKQKFIKQRELWRFYASRCNKTIHLVLRIIIKRIETNIYYDVLKPIKVQL